jgi:hypothetical protein
LKNFVRACSTSTKYWLPSTIWRFMSELVLLLLNTARLQQFEDFCQSLYYLQKSSNWWRWSVFSRSRTSSDKNLQIIEGGQYLVEVEQALTKIFKSIWRFLSEVVLLLLNTDRLQQFEDFCQSLFYFY